MTLFANSPSFKMNGSRGPNWKKWENSAHSVDLSRSPKPWRSQHGCGSICDQGQAGCHTQKDAALPVSGHQRANVPFRHRPGGADFLPHIAWGPFSGEPGLEPALWRQPSLLWVSLYFEQESKFACHAFPCPVCGVFSAGPEGCSRLPCAFRSYWVTSGQGGQAVG